MGKVPTVAWDIRLPPCGRVASIHLLAAINTILGISGASGGARLLEQVFRIRPLEKVLVEERLAFLVGPSLARAIFSRAPARCRPGRLGIRPRPRGSAGPR